MGGFATRFFLVAALAGLGLCSYSFASDSDQEVPSERMQEIFGGDTPKSIVELQAMQAHVKKLVQKLTTSVVSVEIEASQGSGVLVTEDGFVLTAGHVIMPPIETQKNRKTTVRFADGKGFPATSLGVNVGMDSGLVKMETPPDRPYVEMGDSSKLKVGQWVLALGHPGGFQSDRPPVLRLGRILEINRNEIRTDCPLVGGDSGGPLFDMEGKVIGIHSRIGDDLGKNLHVPVNTYGQQWDRLAKGDKWGNFGELIRQPWIGVSGDQQGPEARITRIAPNSPAAKAGLQEGDVIVEFDGNKVTDFKSLAEVLFTLTVHQKVSCSVKRGSETIAVEIEILER